MPALPAKLSDTPDILWKAPLNAQGLGGVAATPEFVLLSDRELNDTADAWKCFAADTGRLLWSFPYPAPGSLDYGNSPRATPVLHEGRAYLFGAFGHLNCVELATGKPLWDMNLRDEFEPADVPKWGACSTPLLIDGKLIVNPGAKAASLAALDAKTGKILWKTPGNAAGYGSFIAMEVDGKTQVIGHDKETLGGWDPATGERLWTLVPEKGNEFNVPTPIAVGGKLVVVGENNGTRLHAFDAKGRIVPKPLAVNRRLTPDTHTPVAVGGRLLGFDKRLKCLDLADLKEIWDAADKGFTKYCALVADDSRALMITMDGELILIDPAGDEYKPLGRMKVFEGEKGIYSHPAFAGGRLFLRGANEVRAMAWMA